MPAPTWAKGCTLGARQAVSHLYGVSNPARVCSPYQPLPSHCPLLCDLWQGVTPAPLVTKCSQTVLLILKFWNHFLVSLYGPRFIISSLIRYLLSTYYVPIHLWHMVMNQIDLVSATEMMIITCALCPHGTLPVAPFQRWAPSVPILQMWSSNSRWELGSSLLSLPPGWWPTIRPWTSTAEAEGKLCRPHPSTPKLRKAEESSCLSRSFP